MRILLGVARAFGKSISPEIFFSIYDGFYFKIWL